MNRVRLAGAAVLAGVTALVGACVPPSATPGPDVSQLPPIAANGIAIDGTDLWLCDLFGGQLLRVDGTTGRILERFGPDLGLSSPDDVVVVGDGTLVTTSPLTGDVTRIRPGATPSVQLLARVPAGVNPITLDPSGGGVIVGYGSGDANRVDRVDLATGAVTTIVSGVPPLNGFSFGPDGALWAPVGGPLSSFTGDGGVVRIDLAAGTWARVPLTFPDEAGRAGFTFPVSAKWGADGRLRVLQGVGPAALYEVVPDPVGTTATARRLATLGDTGDNLAVAADGTTYATRFVGGIDRVAPDGAVTPLPLGG